MTQVVVMTSRMVTTKNPLRRIVTTLVGKDEIKFIPKESYGDKPTIEVLSIVPTCHLSKEYIFHLIMADCLNSILCFLLK